MERIGGYGVVRKLGEGGMGMVWLARSRGGRLVAVKVARPELAGDPVFRERFRAEVAAARSVGGFHTAQVVDADPDAEAPWLATAYVPGPTLARLVAEQGPMDEERLRGLGAALAEALQAIHRCGLVHRDLKPANIVMAEDGPRVLDFGIARAVENTRLTVTGTAFGTPGFLAPEQAEGGEVGAAADVFALGAVLIAAAGGSAFGGGTPVALMYRSVHQDPDLSAVPEPLRPMVAACMEKDPLRRPDTDRLLDWFSPPDEEPRDVAAGSTNAGPVDARPVDFRPADAMRPLAGAPRPAAAAGPPAPSTPAPAGPSVPPMPGYAPAPPVPLPPSPYAPTSPYPPVAGYGYPGPAPAGPGYGVQPVDQPPPGAPEFLAMDRKNAILADAAGISLGANGEVREFPWPSVDVIWCERGAGRRHVLVVALTLHDDSLHSCEVGTRQPAELDGWIASLSALLAYYHPED
ncbi:Serine/threonine protein kinase [Actinacidiphila yanglinensis]|uniref:Serine/threonine protein kinase n=1 Tax=Actinacidiphila yanglinensis TaxID=310779 RepID=A0A1H6AEB6_9ACTN|nr:serine/threonine-protein kinase [Actinacidiphila yanglinensis]SEG46365.1 Serine/threonine protein kinase [Actinacidiphila yanglinensis]